MTKPHINDSLQISKLPASRVSLKTMGIARELAGKLVTVTQSCDIGISFQVNPFIGDPHKEFHLTHEHAKNIFPDSYGKAKK